MSRNNKVKQQELNLDGIPKRDFLLSGVAGIFGFVVSFLPYSGPDLSQPDVNSWVRLYGQVGRHILTWPWSLILLVLLAFLLVHSRFRRGGLGVAFCLGIVLGKTVSTLHW